ncbi:hypothetical protein EVAR_28919_1 [Eumeta japonica]|uniref:Uncharacterized protein n=1 Tax=Eumeta variegata TaxID=151549 RepID=A0A4C1YIT1_EUMVA|nr:hypothetical protein EVAR_28919_1 [Eumeta japonica]
MVISPSMAYGLNVVVLTKTNKTRRKRDPERYSGRRWRAVFSFAPAKQITGDRRPPSVLALTCEFKLNDPTGINGSKEPFSVIVHKHFQLGTPDKSAYKSDVKTQGVYHRRYLEQRTVLK